MFDIKPLAYSLVLTCISLSAHAEPEQGKGKASYSPATRNDYPVQIFWGDTHVHTNLSPDSFNFGNRGLTPEQAYRFARGERVTASNGISAQLSRPLDFLMVADHAEFMGVFPRIFGLSPDIVDTPLGQRWGNYIKSGDFQYILTEFVLKSMNLKESHIPEPLKALDSRLSPQLVKEINELEVPEKLEQSIWNQVGQVADRFNQPGRFTAFIGYEWSSMPGGNNLHRNVMFRDDASKTSQVVPFSALESSDPEDLWQYLSDYENKTGGRVLAIPHNGNLSNGLMFAESTLKGKPLDKDYAERRGRWEPVVEVTQMKGDGEAHPFLSPTDEFADYGTWDMGNVGGQPKNNQMLEFEYARSALKNGLALQGELGLNPYAFGMIGSTDTHTSLATADEDNFFGKLTTLEPAAGRINKNFGPGESEGSASIAASATLASGYAAIWARENTRESLFDALIRRETYATTGPRITVRFFGGWNFEEGDEQRPDLAVYGYAHGVPMGSELYDAPSRIRPKFMIAAMKDPLGANLDRIQVIKGWVDDNGATHEKIYNVAASDKRRIRRNKVDPVGNTVNVEQASYRNSIGDPALAVVWEDPDFDPDIKAFYYARILEIPTPVWTTIDAAYYGDQLPSDVPAYQQERAYTSPIWYSPKSE